MNEIIDIVFNNLDTIVDCGAKVVEVVGGCAIISSLLPHGIKPIDANKVKGYLAIGKKVVNGLIIIYNAVIGTANIAGFNFFNAKNKEKDTQK